MQTVEVICHESAGKWIFEFKDTIILGSLPDGSLKVHVHKPQKDGKCVCIERVLAPNEIKSFMVALVKQVTEGIAELP
ncbi:MAG: hypothetical protein PHI12_11990 [Dehalococcoidales bacterium]|nr:hypothetical protein [Dehalococcoidales bacterium]